MTRKHQYSQHFLRSPGLVAELIGHTNIRKNDTVYDLGAGSGVITNVLARRTKKVVAVEMEPGALAKLRQNTGSVENVQILQEDILSFTLPVESYKIFANIPFAISSEVVQRFLLTDKPPKSMYLVVQKQFAKKLIPSNQHFNSALGAQLWPWYALRIRRPLKRNDFTPPPAVDTVLLEIKPRDTLLLPQSDRAHYCQLIQQSFARQQFFAALPRTEVGISSEAKPSELTPEQWIQLYTAN